MNEPSIPILIYSDAPCKNTGLARITRDLALLINTRPETRDRFRAASYGHFGNGNKELPFQQYCVGNYEEGQKELRKVWENWSEGYRGILLTITPPSWIFWLACPKYAYLNDDGTQNREFKAISDWIQTKPFDVWAYLAIENCSWFDKFNTVTKGIIEGVERPLFYTRWGAWIAEKTFGDGVRRSWIHHGIWSESWKRASRERIWQLRKDVGMGPNDLLIGCVATNTTRKRLGLLFPMIVELQKLLSKNLKVKLWLHTDVMQRDWSLMGLITDFGFSREDIYITSSNAARPDSWLCEFYSACDVTVLPTLGEGFGYPVIESLACGTPVITSSFGGQAELLMEFRPGWLVAPVGKDIDGINNLVKVCYNPKDWSEAVLRAWGEKRTRTRQDGSCDLEKECAAHAANWDWERQWPLWVQWLKQGIEPGGEVEYREPVHEHA